MRQLQFLVFIFVPIINFGSNWLISENPFDDNARVLIQPAGYAFAIWGPIFLGMLIYSWFQMQKERIESTHLMTATLAGISAGLASIAFVPISYTGMQWLGLVDVLWHLISLIILFIALRKQIELEKNPNTHWFYLPTQMYLGWICAATAISVALFLKELGVGYDLATEANITAVIIGALILIGIFMAFQRGMVVPLVFIWALVALIAENGEFMAIKYASWIGIAILAVVSGWQIMKRKRLAF